MFLPKARNENIVVQDMENETLVYDLTVDKVYCLNQIAALVFSYCDGHGSFEMLKQKHKLTDEIIYLALDQLRKENLLEETEDYRSPFIGTSRREVIRKAGLTSLASLPWVSSIIAPKAAMAQSIACPPGSPNPAGIRAGQPVGNPITAAVADCAGISDALKKQHL